MDHFLYRNGSLHAEGVALSEIAATVGTPFYCYSAATLTRHYQLFKEALGHTFEEPKRWQLHSINEIMNTVVTGWKPFSNPRMFAGYGRQKGWERDTSGNELPSNEGGFVELSEEECRQLELPQEWIA